MCLTISAVFLNCCSAYDDQAKSQGHFNIQYNIPATYDILKGCSQYVNPVTWAQIGQQVYFQEVSDLTFKALKACILCDFTAYIDNLVQQPGELFTYMLG